MKHRLFTIVAAVSLLVCVAVVVVWVRSQFVMDRVVVNSTQDYVEFNGRRNGLWLLWIHERRDGPLWVSVEHLSRPPHVLFVRPYSWWHRSGFTFERQVRSAVEHHTWVTVPYWFLVGLAAVAPAVLVRRLWRRRRERAGGLCPSCGYDLRATPGRCPECGEVPVRASVSGKASA